MAVSNRKRRQVKEALSKEAYEILRELAPESLEHAPESWEPETRRIFDLVMNFQTKAGIAIDAVLIA